LAAAAAVAIAIGAAAVWFAKGRGKAGAGLKLPFRSRHARARPGIAARPAAAGRKGGAFSGLKERLRKIKPSGRKKYIYHYQPE
jgi:hypothetical protein